MGVMAIRFRDDAVDALLGAVLEHASVPQCPLKWRSGEGLEAQPRLI
jgi:hypothetical protein